MFYDKHTYRSNDDFIGRCEIDLKDYQDGVFTTNLELTYNKSGWNAPVRAGTACISMKLVGFGDADKQARLLANLQFPRTLYAEGDKDTASESASESDLIPYPVPRRYTPLSLFFARRISKARQWVTGV